MVVGSYQTFDFLHEEFYLTLRYLHEFFIVVEDAVQVFRRVHDDVDCRFICVSDYDGFVFLRLFGRFNMSFQDCFAPMTSPVFF